MESQFERTALLFGDEAIQRLKAAKVAVFGVGGVGGHAAEALARTGIGAIDLYDDDTVSLSNINRQIVALHSTVGRYKADVMAERIKDINPDCKAGAFRLFYMPDTASKVDLAIYDYIVDATDTVAAKVELVVRAKEAGVEIICAMGAANKNDPTRFRVTDVHKTEGDPLARAVRKMLRARGITGVKAVCSAEVPYSPDGQSDETALPGRGNPSAPGSNAFAPPALGLIMAGEVVKDLIKEAGVINDAV